MTIDQLFDQGIRRVRRPDDVPGRYIQLDSIGGLRSPYGVLHQEDGSTMEVPVWDLCDDDYAPYEGPATYKGGAGPKHPL